MAVREIRQNLYKKFKPTIFDSGIGARLPDAYRKFYDEWKNTPPKSVHYIPTTGKTWVRNEVTGEIKRIENVPLPLKFPKEFHDILTGGEAIVQGMVRNKRYSTRVPRFWIPKIYRSVVYSEIFDKYLSTLMTNRVVELIHEYQAFDKYILETKACDLNSLLALKLKKKMLTALSNRDLPYNEEKNNEIYQKYEKYLLPPEEIEWYGLSFSEACLKLKEIDEVQQNASLIPLKQIYRAQLIEELKMKVGSVKEDKPKEKNKIGWIGKIPGVSKFTTKS